jgi:ATP-dependent exoDNAse (exonuclease V) beta subunit
MSEESKKFIVYKSSAGSGKTFTLVREYLKIVLQNPESFRQVLAITFTNKAANEMKDRVVRNLVILSDPEKHADSDTVKYMLPELAKQLQISKELIKSRAAIVLRLIMHHYAEFAISTIDSFTHRVIRTFAHDLKIPMNFEVELDADSMLSQAVDILISQVGSDEMLTRVMVDFVEKKAGDELNWQIEKDLNDFGRTLLSESSLDAINEIRSHDLDTFMKVRQSLMQWRMIWEKKLIMLAREVTALFNREGLTADDFIYKDKGIFAYFRNLAGEKFDKIKPNSYAEKALKSGEWINTKSVAGQMAAFERIAAQVLPVGQQILSIIELELPRYILCKLLLNNLFSTALLSEIEKTLNTLCNEDNKLLISEFNRRISQVVQDQPAPFIYERLGEKYHHYLIDEFQDTSIMQWHNLLPLVENSLASNRMNLVVGDAKQAIYRWRSGDAAQFEMLPKLIRSKPDPLLDAREQVLEHHYQKEDLDKNHRSSPVIVDFNNRLFECISRYIPKGYSEAFMHAKQEAAKKNKPGMVRIEKIAKSEPEDDHYENKVHGKILSIITELLEDRFQCRDLAILCRNNAKASKIASFLIREGIPVISSESLLLTQSEQVNFLVAWLKHLVDHADTIPMAHILKYLERRGMLSNTTMEDLFGYHAQPDAEVFHKLLAGQFSFFSFDHLKGLEIFRLIQYLIYHFNFNKLNDSYLRFFQDAILEFVKTSRGGLPEFLEWWEEKSEKLSVVIPEGINAVRIMTIHKAKGLQFPVVIYPFADETLRSTKNNLWVSLDEDFARPVRTACLPVQKNLTETVYGRLYDDEMSRSVTDLVNVMYVALTRPEERLYVILKDLPEKTEDPASVPKFISRFLMEEQTWEKERDLYQYGERWQRDMPAGIEEEQSAEGPSDGRAALKMLLRRHAPAAWDIENPEKNREWGNLVHLVMSKISNEKQPEGILLEMFEDGLISSGQKAELAVMISSLLEQPGIARFFVQRYEARNEPEILTGEGHLYRPDRILFNQDGVTVIDFKTGRHRDEHRAQVVKYTELLAEMKYRIEGAYLLYLNKQPEVVKVV